MQLHSWLSLCGCAAGWARTEEWGGCARTDEEGLGSHGGGEALGSHRGGEVLGSHRRGVAVLTRRSGWLCRHGDVALLGARLLARPAERLFKSNADQLGMLAKMNHTIVRVFFGL